MKNCESPLAYKGKLECGQEIKYLSFSCITQARMTCYSSLPRTDVFL